MSEEVEVTIPNVPALSSSEREEAEELTRKIRVELVSAHSLIVEAFRSRAWAVLGYDSWDAYCQGEFEGMSLQPPRDERLQVIQSMREEGMSSRAIASATNLSQSMVTRELSRSQGASGESNDSAEMPIIGLDGKSYPPKPTFIDVPLDDSLLDLSAEEFGIGLKTERPVPRVIEKPRGIQIPGARGAAALSSSLSRVTESAKSALAVCASQGDEFPVAGLLEASRSIVITSGIVSEANVDIQTISDVDKAALRGDLQDAVDRLNRLLDRLVGA